MRVVNKKLWVITITLLVVIECIFTYLSFKSFSYKEIDKIKEENKVNKEMVAMYVEQEDGTYKEGEYFPGVTYELNYDKTSCVDNKKNNVSNDIVTYNNGKLTVSSNKTVFCYLYFENEAKA